MRLKVGQEKRNEREQHEPRSEDNALLIFCKTPELRKQQRQCSVGHLTQRNIANKIKQRHEAFDMRRRHASVLRLPGLLLGAACSEILHLIPRGRRLRCDYPDCSFNSVNSSR